MSIVVAIIGRPNVGKSTLFNRLIGKKHALVDDTPGVTRDRRQGVGNISDLEFTVFDTAGLEGKRQNGLINRMREQTEAAVLDADIVLLLIDAQIGITPLDADLCKWVRRFKNDVILVANKCESRSAEAGVMDAYSLGLGNPVAISAEHGQGMADLYSALADIPTKSSSDPAVMRQVYKDEVIRSNSLKIKSEPKDNLDTLRLAVVGRPNVGKSTLINALLGENRVLTGPEAGITRDSIEVEWIWRKKLLRLFDTAGLRRKSKVNNRLEKASGDDTWRAIRFAHVVILVLDSSLMLERQDLNIARVVIEEGRSLVLAANKWDLVNDRSGALRLLKNRVRTSLPQVKDVPCVVISALEHKNLDKLLEQTFTIYDVWNEKIATSQLNRWLAATVERHPPPLVQGRRIKLRYITQMKARPPSFVCFCNQPSQLPESYKRYIINELRREFSLPGVPIRLLIRGGKNPYVGDSG